MLMWLPSATVFIPRRIKNCTKTKTMGVVYCTVRFTLVLCVRVAKFPVNDGVNVPRSTFFGAEKWIVTVLVPASATELGLTVQVEFGGPPLQVRETLPVRPPRGATEIV